MINHTQATQDTKHTTSETLESVSTTKKKPGRKPQNVPRETKLEVKTSSEEQTFTPDTPDSFERKIGQAQLDGVKWVETDPKMFDYLVKNQKVKPDHIMYKNIMVTHYGQTEAIKAKHNISADDQW